MKNTFQIAVEIEKKMGLWNVAGQNWPKNIHMSTMA